MNTKTPTIASTQLFLMPDGTTDTLGNIILQNKTIIRKALEQLKFEELSFDYSAANDSDPEYKFSVNPQSGDGSECWALEMMVATLHVGSYFCPGGKTWESRCTLRQQSLSDALKDFAEMVIESSGFLGYGQDDGGEGTIAFDMENNSVTHDHYKNIVTQEHCERSY